MVPFENLRPEDEMDDLKGNKHLYTQDAPWPGSVDWTADVGSKKHVDLLLQQFVCRYRTQRNLLSSRMQHQSCFCVRASSCQTVALFGLKQIVLQSSTRFDRKLQVAPWLFIGIFRHREKSSKHWRFTSAPGIWRWEMVSGRSFASSERLGGCGRQAGSGRWRRSLKGFLSKYMSR